MEDEAGRYSDPAAVVKGYVCAVLFAAASRDAATGGEREHSKRSHAGRESLAVGAWRNAAAAAGGDGSTVGWGLLGCSAVAAAAAAGVRRQVLADALAARLAAWADRAGAGRDASAVLTDVAGSAGHGLAALRYALVGAGLAGLAAAAWSAVTALDAGAILTDFSRRAGHARAGIDADTARTDGDARTLDTIARVDAATGATDLRHWACLADARGVDAAAQLAALSDRAQDFRTAGVGAVTFGTELVGWAGGVVVDDSVAVIVDAIALFGVLAGLHQWFASGSARAQTLGDAAAAGAFAGRNVALLATALAG